MDMYWSICLYVVLLTLPLLLLLLLRGHKHGGKSHRRRLPPGPPSLPLLGSVVWLTNSPADAEPLLRRLFSRYGPVVSLRVGSRLSVYVADRRVTHAALVDHGAALPDHPGALVVAAALLGENSNTITRASHGPAWRLLRRNIVAGTLHPSRVRLAYAPARSWARRVLSEKLLLLAGEEEDVLGAFRHAVFCLLTAMCFGERLDEGTVRAIAAAQRDQQLYFGSKMAVFAFLPSVTRHLFRGRLETARALRRRHRELLVPLIDARRHYIKNNNKHSSETTTFLEHSYVDTLLDVRLPPDAGEESDRPLSEQEVVNLCTEFLTAGTDTTTSAMQWIMAELVKNPDIQNKLYSEIKGVVPDNGDLVTEEDLHSMPYLRAVVLEGLRKHPPSHLVLPHRAAEDVEVGTYLIPKGATVNFMVAEMGRDAEEWENPTEFAPERFLHDEAVDVTGSREIRMMPFGVGRRICPGLGIAMLHLEYLVANMVREFEWKEVVGDEVDMAEKRGFTCFMEKPLRPRLVPRRKSENQFACGDNELVVD